ncbi:glycosyl transferase family 1 [Micromonospora chalcea]|uniref:glycosyltransferase n=1 Tax=Micromonospora chalcea TaxID=1874 RepID=UPI0023794571|nr:glycosyltransferase [Micromonospora chalcea]WDQ00493.1 glycosyl transferase family 1 [Micromonospora chalcea]
MREFDVDYPRVLVVDQMPFGRSTGTSMTLSNLFHGWPRDRLAQIYTANAVPSTDVCDEYFHFGPSERYLPAQYRTLRLLGWDGSSSFPKMPAIAAVRDAADRRRGAARLYSYLCAADDLTPPRFTARLDGWVREFRPDVVYSMLGSVRLARLVAHCARVARVPVVPHFTDDWPATLYAGGEFLGAGARAVRRAIGRLIESAPLGMAISRPMADEYERRYGIPFSVFLNSVGEEFFQARTTQSEPAAPGRPIRLVYVGALHLERWRSLHAIATAVESITAAGTPMSLHVHCPAEDQARHGHLFDGLAHTRVGPALLPDEVPGALHGADVLIHVESFGERLRRYTRYSVSTKIPQYLAAGRAILGFGPSEVASMAHIRTADAGVIVGVQEPSALLDGLRRLSRHAEREAFGRHGFEYAVRHHRKSQVAAHFASVLQSAVDAPAASRVGRSAVLLDRATGER